MRSSIKYKKSNSGQALVFTMLVILVLLIFSSTLVDLLRMETKWELKQRRSVYSYHLAESGVDRGLWKLRESGDIWDDALEGNPPANYDGSHEFEDVPGGRYKIKISSGPGKYEVTIKSVGIDDSNNELRGIEMIAEKEIYEASYEVNGYLKANNVNWECHWAPVKVAEYIDMKKSVAKKRYYPRKYAQFHIKHRCNKKSEPHTDDTEFWAYGSGGPFEEPQIDLTYYLNAAKAYNTPAGAPSGADPDGSGYYPADYPTDTVRFNNFTDTSTKDADGDPCVYYMEGTAKFTGKCFIRGTMLVMGTKFWTAGKGAMDDYEVDIPTAAYLEYQSDKGKPKTDQEVWDDNSKWYWENEIPYPIDKVSFHGFLYVANDFWNTSSNNIIGVLYIDNNQTDLIGTTVIYYDPDVDIGIRYRESPAKRKSWRSFVPGTWDNPDW